MAMAHGARVSLQCLPSAIVSFGVSRRNIRAVSPGLGAGAEGAALGCAGASEGGTCQVGGGKGDPGRL